LQTLFVQPVERPSREQELGFLKKQAQAMREDLEQIEVRMAEIATDEK